MTNKINKCIDEESELIYNDLKSLEVFDEKFRCICENMIRLMFGDLDNLGVVGKKGVIATYVIGSYIAKSVDSLFEEKIGIIDDLEICNLRQLKNQQKAIDIQSHLIEAYETLSTLQNEVLEKIAYKNGNAISKEEQAKMLMLFGILKMTDKEYKNKEKLNAREKAGFK